MIRVILVSLGFMIRVILMARPLEYPVDACLVSFLSHLDA